MKLRRLFLLLLFASTAPIFGVYGTPMSPADSLKGLLETELSPEERADVLADLAYELRYVDFDSAVAYGKQAIEYASKIDDESALAKAHNALGIVYSKNGSHRLALDQYQLSLEIKERLGDGLKVATAYLNIGEINFYLRNYDMARFYFEKAASGFEEEKNETKLSWAYLNLGNVAMVRDSSVEAREYFLSCLKIQDALEKPRLDVLATCYNGIAISYNKEENYKLAEKYARDALDIAEEGGWDLFITGFSNNLADNLIGQKRYAEAVPYLDNAWEIASRESMGNEMNENHQMRSKYFNGIGKPDSAFFYLQQSFWLKDSIVEAQASEEFANLQVAYDYERQQHKIELLAQEKATAAAKGEERILTMTAMSVGLGLLIVLLVVVVWGNRRQKHTNQMLIEKNNLIDSARAVLQDRNEKLEELNREKDGLIHIVAHDLKAPLNKTLALMSIFENDAPLTENQEQAIGLIKKVNSDAGDLIRSLLDVNAIEHQDSDLSIERLDLNVMVQNLVKEFRKQADNKSIEILVNAYKKPLVIQSDASAVRRIFDNLISNALKFSQQNSIVMVNTELKNGAAVVKIQDEGPGISEKDQKKLFGKFQKLSARPTGGESSTGLGLAIVKALSDQLDAGIEVDSQLGRGTEFTLTFPLAQVQEPAPKVADPS